MARRDKALSAAQKMEVRQCYDLLQGSGLSLLAAVKLGMGKAGQVVRKVSLEEARDLLIRDALRRKLRAPTVDFYLDRLDVFVRAWPEGACLDDVQRADLKLWLEQPGWEAGTSRATFRAVRRLYNFAREQEPVLCATNPCEGLKLAAVRVDREIDFLTADEVAAILSAPGVEPYAAGIALMAFSGVRPEELRGRAKRPMLWGELDFKARVLRVPAELAKTRKARVIEGLESNFWAWMRKYRGGDNEPILVPRVRQAQRFAREVIGRSWPKDGFRHAFATHHVALRNDVARTSIILGHEGDATMLHRHYRGLVGYDAGKWYFGIVPG